MFEFKNFDFLTDRVIDLKIDEKLPGIEEKGYVPVYRYHIVLHGSNNVIGSIEIRIGSNENTYYGGHIGYKIDESYRGNGYAAKACRIIKDVAIAHGMKQLIITCNPTNIASKRTCENAGLTYMGIEYLPSHNLLYKVGERQVLIYEWILD